MQSHLEAVDVRRGGYAEVPVPRRFKTVVTSSAGYPLDKTYYQTVKGMVGPIDILEPGGDLIVASACSEGMGSPHYVEAQRRLVELGPDGFWTSIEGKPHADIDEWQTQMQLKPMRVGRVRLYSDGPERPRSAGLTGVERIASRRHARSPRAWRAPATRASPSCRRGPTWCRSTRRRRASGR